MGNHCQFVQRQGSEASCLSLWGDLKDFAWTLGGDFSLFLEACSLTAPFASAKLPFMHFKLEQWAVLLTIAHSLAATSRWLTNAKKAHLSAFIILRVQGQMLMRIKED
eukprot:scaffold175839_cov17-Tisochrysis_lutea.AAC.2